MENNDSLCIKCNKTFRDIYELKRHQNKKFPCDRYEKLTENGQIKYKCAYCKKLFSGLQSANYHQNHSCDSAKNTIKKNNEDINDNNNSDDNKNGIFIKNNDKLFDLIELSSSNTNITSILDSSSNKDNNSNILTILLEQLKIQNEKIAKLESQFDLVKKK